MRAKQPFQNFVVDHLTILLDPKLYTASYAAFRIIFGTTPDDLLYEKRRKQPNGSEISMTYATRVGEWKQGADTGSLHTVFALVQPSEPASQPSHVREMLNGHNAAAHLQHIALRTSDLIAFHRHAVERGVQFITPVLKDDEENLIQVFSGEWFIPGGPASGFFFEFLQRNPTPAHMQELQKVNKQTWFRDQTFLGLYDEKEQEYQSGKVRQFLPEALQEEIAKFIGAKQVWEITESDLDKIEGIMMTYAAKNSKV